MLGMISCGNPPSPSKTKQETDDRPSARTDALLCQSAKISGYINAELDKIRSTLLEGHSTWSSDLTPELLLRVKNIIGGNRRGTGVGLDHVGIPLEVSQYTEAESWMMQTLKPNRGEILFTKFKDSRYGDNPIGPIAKVVPAHITEATADHSIAPIVKIDRYFIGIDKIGHLFQQGYWYYDATVKGLLTDDHTRFQFGQFMEGDPQLAQDEHKKYKKVFGEYCGICTFLGGFGYFGATSTGVISFADMAANESGFHFYKNLSENPLGYYFDFSDFDVATWNEEINPNGYIPELKIRP